MTFKLNCLLTLILLQSLLVNAQEDATNVGTMFISNATIVAAEGSFTTTPAGSTENGGDFYLKGHWTNNGTYITSTGSVTFWGTRAQTINGTSLTVYYNAIVDKPSNGVTLNVNTEVSHVLTLTNGKVDLNSNKITISNDATTGIGYTNGYLLSEKTDNSSKVQWNIGSTTGAHIIPFGKASGLIIPLTLNLTGGTVGNVTSSTYPSNTDNTPYPVTPIQVFDVNDQLGNDNSASIVDRFWEIDKSGPNGTLTITFTYDDAEKPANGEANLVSQRYNSSTPAWDMALPGQSADITLNTVTTPGITTFGPYILSQTTTLPVELLVFNAVPNKKGQVDVSWATASEQNSDYFTVERSKDGHRFETVTKVKAAGNSTSDKYYRTDDKNPFAGISYYRLKQTDFNGAFSYSETKTVNFGNAASASISIFPNPAGASATIYFPSSDMITGKLKVNLFDAMGKLIISREFVQSANMNNGRLVIDRNNLASGVYSVKIFGDGETIYFGKIIFQ